jgi:ppGpp synthetase/RelA/SpoT-type nucleotidyltranferase
MTEAHSRPQGTPPRRGLSLGWRLAISTALIVTVIAGVVTILQQRHELRMDRDAREALLKESTAPLVHRLAGVASQEQLKEEFTVFCHSFVMEGYRAHRMELRDGDGQVVVSTLSDTPARPKKFFRVSVPVVSPVLAGQQGTLTLWEDSSDYNKMVFWQWRSWLLAMVVTVLPILLFVMLAIRFVVTGPLEKLLDRVRKMERGYWEQMPFDEGPWEIRWLGWRFRNLGLELKNTVEELVKAERRASKCLRPAPVPGQGRDGSQEAETGAVTVSSENQYEARCDQLRQKYQDLISMDANDPRTLELARTAWNTDASEAGQLGDMELKGALEDASMRVLEPRAFLDLQGRLEAQKDSMAAWITQVEADLRTALTQENIPYAEIAHRVKHLAGIWKKAQVKGLALDEVDDVYAFRIIVPTESDCYAALGAIHETFRPVVGRFNDYIATPKPNGYQSIHTCVRAATGPVFEIQIRSVAMHHEAERGSAAHWIYKEQQSVSAPDKASPPGFLRRLQGIWKREPAPGG